jgi:hypothetical protein
VNRPPLDTPRLRAHCRSDRRHGLRRLIAAACAAIALVGCGGGGGDREGAGAPAPGGQPGGEPVGQIPLALAAKAVDTGGRPIAGVTMTWATTSLLERTTDADGMAAFAVTTEPLPQGSFLGATKAGYHPAFRLLPPATVADSQITDQVTLISVNDLQLTLSRVAVEVSSDASSAVITADIAVAERGSILLEPPSTANVRVYELDCLFSAPACILESTGEVYDLGWWTLSPSVPLVITGVPGGPSNVYRLRYGIVSSPGMFTAGRAVVTGALFTIRDSQIFVDFNAPL